MNKEITVTEIRKKVDEYAKLNESAKQAEKLKKEIKEYLAQANITSLEGKEYKVWTTTRTTTSFDEEKLIDLLKSYDIDAIRTKEYVDEDLLENAIYNGQVPTEVVEAIRKLEKTKITVVLNQGRLG